jgi:ATP-dependent DNA helicase RecQ
VHLREYEMWASKEDEELGRLYREGLSISQLAESHQRSNGAIRSRLDKLGLLQKSI